MLKQVEKREERAARRHPGGGEGKGRRGRGAAATRRRRASWLATGTGVLLLAGGLARSRWQSSSRSAPTPVVAPHTGPTEERALLCHRESASPPANSSTAVPVASQEA